MKNHLHKEAFKLLLINLTMLILTLVFPVIFTIGFCIKNTILTIVGLNGFVLMTVVIFTLINMDKKKQDDKSYANKERMKFIKGYIKLLKKRDSELEIEILEDVCYQLYTYGYVRDIKYLENIKKEKDE